MKNIQEEYTKRTLVMESQPSVAATVNDFSDPYIEQAKQQLYTLKLLVLLASKKYVS